jgi:hypothetical protein
MAPARVDSVLRAFDGSRAAMRLPTKGRRTRVRSGRFIAARVYGAG